MDEQCVMVQGFKASATAAGLKKHGGADMALIVSETECAAAGVFTTSKVKAAPVLVSGEHLSDGRARAIVVNAGNANACTGEQGIGDARETAALAGAALGIDACEVLVASTGVIGQRLDMGRVREAVPRLVAALSPEGFGEAAGAMLTTDSFKKLGSFTGTAAGRPYRIVGIAKGAGMIMPNMATMLCFILTDLRIGRRDLQASLSAAVEPTFNRITVDGDTSTNDTVFVLANGKAGNDSLSPEEIRTFEEGLTGVMGELARMIVRDGEGATKVIDMIVKGAGSPQDAEKAARTLANSSLVKTACYGQDPNWGRIMAALGRADIVMDECLVDVWVDGVRIVAGGLAVGREAEEAAAKIMHGKEFSLVVDLNQGPHTDRVLTCDLTHDYVSINADYRT